MGTGRVSRQVDSFLINPYHCADKGGWWVGRSRRNRDVSGHFVTQPDTIRTFYCLMEIPVCLLWVCRPIVAGGKSCGKGEC